MSIVIKITAAVAFAGLVIFSTTANALEFPSVTNLPPTPVVANRPPLLATPFAALPLGSVRPLGWLLTQCQMQRDGITGHAEELYADDLGTNSAWLGGTGENWERGPYYFKGLVALAYTLNDPGLKQKAQKWMDWLLDHQWSDGYIGPTANNDWWPRIVATYALKDYYEATADPRVPTVLSNYFHYMLANLPSRPLKDWGKARAGDEMAVALWLYNRNGDTNLLTLVNLLHQQAYNWSDIFSSNTFLSYGTDFQPKHNVNVEQALKMPEVYYQLSHQPFDHAALDLGLTNLMQDDALSCGINSGTEFLAGDSSIEGVELCAIVEAMLSLETDVQITGDPSLGDRLEMIAYNALPAALANHIKAIQYYTLANNVIAVYGNHGFNQDYANGTLPGPYSGYPCCRYNFQMGWPKFVQNSWAATADGGLAVIAYAPTVVNAMAGGKQVQITEDTGYPFEQQVRLQVCVSNTVTFQLVLRIPSWCSNAVVTINGQAQSGVAPDTFFRVERTWTNGDLVVVDLPMPNDTVTGPRRAVAINRGPLVYSLRIGEDWTVRTPGPLGLGFNEYQVTPTTPWNYALQLDPSNPSASLTFTNYSPTTPTNPFDPAEPSVALLAQARQVPSWTIGWSGTQAFEPPVSPVASTNPLVPVTLVPFGSQHLRVSWFPYLGTPSPTTGFFTENFDPTWCRRWTTFGGNWWAHDGTLNTVPASANGAKAVEMATAFTNFTYEADVLVGPVGNAGLIFRVSKPDIGADAYCGYYTGINAQDSQLEFGYTSNGWHSITNIPMTIAANTFYHLKVETAGSRIRIFVNSTNQPVVDLQDSNFDSGMIGVRDYCTDGNQSISSFSHLVVTESAAPVQGRQAWYPFEDNALDASGNGNDGTISGNVKFAPGKLGAFAAQFDGTSNTFISIPRSVSNDFTIAFWVRTTDTGGSGQWYDGRGLVDGEVSGVMNDFGVSLVGNLAAFGVGNPDTTIYTTDPINDGNWHHITATRDAVSGQMDLYLDGMQEGSTKGPTGTRSAPPDLCVGSLQTKVTDGFFSGEIDDVQLFDRVFSANEVPSLMNHPPTLAAISDTNLLAGRTLLITNTASDPDSPAQTLTFGLPGAPSGAAINATTGVLTWRPGMSEANTTYPFEVSVADDGVPSNSAVQSFKVTVLPPAKPVLGFLSLAKAGFQMSVAGDTGPDYSIYTTTNLSSPSWSLLLTTNPASTPFFFTDALAAGFIRRFYRVQLGP